MRLQSVTDGAGSDVCLARLHGQPVVLATAQHLPMLSWVPGLCNVSVMPDHWLRLSFTGLIVGSAGEHPL